MEQAFYDADDDEPSGGPQTYGLGDLANEILEMILGYFFMVAPMTMTMTGYSRGPYPTRRPYPLRPPPRYSPLRMVVIAMGVCSQWRVIALNYAQRHRLTSIGPTAGSKGIITVPIPKALDQARECALYGETGLLERILTKSEILKDVDRIHKCVATLIQCMAAGGSSDTFAVVYSRMERAWFYANLEKKDLMQIVMETANALMIAFVCHLHVGDMDYVEHILEPAISALVDLGDIERAKRLWSRNSSGRQLPLTVRQVYRIIRTQPLSIVKRIMPFAKSLPLKDISECKFERRLLFSAIQSESSDIVDYISENVAIDPARECEFWGLGRHYAPGAIGDVPKIYCMQREHQYALGRLASKNTTWFWESKYANVINFDIFSGFLEGVISTGNADMALGVIENRKRPLDLRQYGQYLGDKEQKQVCDLWRITLAYPTLLLLRAVYGCIRAPLSAFPEYTLGDPLRYRIACIYHPQHVVALPEMPLTIDCLDWLIDREYERRIEKGEEFWNVAQIKMLPALLEFILRDDRDSARWILNRLPHLKTSSHPVELALFLNNIPMLDILYVEMGCAMPSLQKPLRFVATREKRALRLDTVKWLEAASRSSNRLDFDRFMNQEMCLGHFGRQVVHWWWKHQMVVSFDTYDDDDDMVICKQ